MFILYFIIVFFILIFNILIPIIIERIQLEEEISNSQLGTNFNKITCHNNSWFYIDKSVFGLSIKYLVDENNKLLTCDKNFNSVNTTKTCGKEGEYNNRYHPCFSLLSELLFYRSIKNY